jgi:hypothetical protein
MTYTYKFTALLISTSFFTALALANTNKQSVEDYKILMLEDCKVVAEKTMTTSQVRAYEALKEQEQLMQGLELPITAITEQIEQYSSEIEELTALAVQETDTSLYIDKTYMRQQEAAVDKLQALISSHQNDFDALENQGYTIGRIAEEFEQEIAPSIENFKHDQIRIVGPDSSTSGHSCYSGTSHT